MGDGCRGRSGSRADAPTPQSVWCDGLSDGRIVSLLASATEIVAAFNAFAGRGFFVEPTSATAGAVFDKILRSGRIQKSETTVLVLTGHGLKAMEKIIKLAA